MKAKTGTVKVRNARRPINNKAPKHDVIVGKKIILGPTLSAYNEHREDLHAVVSLFSEVYTSFMTPEQVALARAEFYRRVKENGWEHWFR